MTLKEKGENNILILWFEVHKYVKFLTATTESLAATAKMSAQDTTPGHKSSN